MIHISAPAETFVASMYCTSNFYNCFRYQLSSAASECGNGVWTYAFSGQLRFVILFYVVEDRASCKENC